MLKASLAGIQIINFRRGRNESGIWKKYRVQKVRASLMLKLTSNSLWWYRVWVPCTTLTFLKIWNLSFLIGRIIVVALSKEILWLAEIFQKQSTRTSWKMTLQCTYVILVSRKWGTTTSLVTVKKDIDQTKEVESGGLSVLMALTNRLNLKFWHFHLVNCKKQTKKIP